MELRFLRDVIGIYNTSFPKASVKVYYPWEFVWQGMTEQERVRKGVFVECSGQGEFDVFLLGRDVEIVET